MPTLTTYEREDLTNAQYLALGVYLARKRQKETTNFSGVNGYADNVSIGEEATVVSSEIPKTPAKSTARENYEEKKQALKDVKVQLAELEVMLGKLKNKKHELFEEVKSLVHNKKCAELRERQMQGYPSPFMLHPIAPRPAMINVLPFRPGMKMPKSPSPPVVQLYSPFPNSTQPAFSSLGNRMPGPLENTNPAYQFQQNFLHQQVQGPRGILPTNPPRPPGNPPFMQQNMQHNTTNENAPLFSPSGKDRQSHRPQGYVKRDNHMPSRSRYY